MNELHLFAGAGGGILGGILLGHTCVCAVEIEPYCRKVLLQRQRDGILPKFPIWDDVKTFDGKPWQGLVDIVCGGFPCQDISGAKTVGGNAGLAGERSGLWTEMRRIISEVRPRFAFVENSPMLTIRGLDRILGDLAEMGYDALWGVLAASDAGAPHLRERIWIVAHSCKNGRVDRIRQNQFGTERTRRIEAIRSSHWKRTKTLSENREVPIKWKAEPDPLGMANGVAFQVDRLAAVGNGQVPDVVKLAWNILAEGIDAQPL